jgi:hypothetical protein
MDALHINLDRDNAEHEEIGSKYDGQLLVFS